MATRLNLTFGDLLRRYRLAAGLTQEELAERATLSVRAISDLERGIKNAPRRHTLQMLAEALQLTEGDQAALEAAVARPHDRALPDVHAAHATTLPIAPTPFVGRRQEVEEVGAMLVRNEVRLLTLTGPGGIGKTRLALRVAEGVQRAFPDGVVFVPLANLADAQPFLTTIAAALEVTEAQGQPILERLAQHLRMKRLLLILDNFEHVLPAAEAVSGLLTACPEFTVLVTSRAVLHIAAEREYPVPPLAGAVPGHVPDPAVLSRSDAVQLFVQRAQAVKPGFQPTDESVRVIAEICLKLDGLPLAIELAAARIKVLPAEALLYRLDRRLEVLTGGARDLPPRQQTMRDTLAWSYDLLDGTEQALFRRFAAFAGGATLAAAEAVCNVPKALGRDILDGLTALIDNSLLQVEEQETAAGYPEPRFVMPDTIREYGLDRLREAREDAKVRRAHAAAYLTLAEEAAPELRGAEQRPWLTWLETESVNLWLALQWAEESGEPVIGLRIATALWRFWGTRGRYTEGRSRLEALLELEERMGHPAPPLLRALALNQAARFADRQGDLARALILSSESLALYRAVGDKSGIAAALSTLGGAMKERGDYKDAMPILEESVALRRELGDTARLASALNSMGGALRWQGEGDRADSLFREALALYTETGDQAAIAHMLFRLGETALDRCDFAEARRLYEESLVLRGDLEDKEGTGFTLNGLALVAHAEGDFQRAAELAERSVTLFREVGARRQISCVLDTLARIELDRGNLERAATSYSECLKLALDVGAKELVPYGLEGLGRVAARRGEPERAARLCGAGAALRDSLNTPLDGHEREAYHRAVGEIRRALSEEAYAAAWQAGQGMSMQQAAAYALEPRLAP